VCAFFPSEINNNFFSVQVFRAGILQHESQHGLHGIAPPPTPTPRTSRRRGRTAEDDTSLVSTSTPRNTRASNGRFTQTTAQAQYIASSPVNVDTTTPVAVHVTSTTSNDDECGVCYQVQIASRQRRCASCQKILCVDCAQEIIVRHSREFFDCPYCRGHFVNDIIDLFGEE
jgi:hypothetical protein